MLILFACEMPCRVSLAKGTARALECLVDGGIGGGCGKVLKEEASFTGAVVGRGLDPTVLVVRVPDVHARAGSRLYVGMDRVVVGLGLRSEFNRGTRSSGASDIEFSSVNFKFKIDITTHDLL